MECDLPNGASLAGETSRGDRNNPDRVGRWGVLHPWAGAIIGVLGVVGVFATGRRAARWILAVAVVVIVVIAAWLLYQLNS